MAEYLSWAPWTHQSLCQCSQCRCWAASGLLMVFSHSHTHTVQSCQSKCSVSLLRKQTTISIALKHSYTFFQREESPPADHYKKYQFKALWQQLHTSEPDSVIFFQLHRLQIFYTECVWHLDLACTPWTQTHLWEKKIESAFQLDVHLLRHRMKVLPFNICVQLFPISVTKKSCQKFLNPDSDTEKVHHV